MQDSADRFDEGLRNRCGHVLQRQVRRYQCDPQAAAGQHHDHLFHPAFFGQIFGVPAEKTAACATVVYHALVQRCGYYSGKQAV